MLPDPRSLIRIATLLLVSSLALAGCSGDPEPRPADIDVARPAKIVAVQLPGASTRTYPGRVQAAHRVSLAFRVGGPITQMLVSKGQKVQQGEVLARIDPRDYEVQVKNLEAQVAAARAQSQQANEEYGRVRGLYESDNASRSDFDRARAALDVSQAQVKAQEQALQAARLSLADTRLRAPSAGTVSDRLVEAHQTVAAGQPILRFQDQRGLEVVIDVPEREVTELTANTHQEIRLRFRALSETAEYSATVKEFATESDPQTRTFPVTLELEHLPDANLLPGMTASARWISSNGKDHHGSVVVPLASVVNDASGETFVWRVDPESMRVSRRAVRTGTLSEDGLEVLEGLTATDLILGAGVHFVTEGQKVRSLEADPED